MLMDERRIFMMDRYCSTRTSYHDCMSFAWTEPTRTRLEEKLKVLNKYWSCLSCNGIIFEIGYVMLDLGMQLPVSRLKHIIQVTHYER